MLVAAADAEAGRGPFADAVEGQDGRLLEGRGEEGAGRVRLVVLGEDDTGPLYLPPSSLSHLAAAGAASA